jgi:hypothetical protein
VLPTLDFLRTVSPRFRPSFSILTSSDPRVKDILISLGMIPKYFELDQVNTTWELGFQKNEEQSWREVIRKTERERGEKLKVGLEEDSEVLVVGDEAEAFVIVSLSDCERFMRFLSTGSISCRDLSV